MEKDIKILEEIVELYYDCAVIEDGFDMRVDMAFMKKETKALENLIKAYKEQQWLLEYKETDLENSIPKSLIKEKIEEIEQSMNKARPFDLSYIEYCEDRIEVLEELLK